MKPQTRGKMHERMTLERSATWTLLGRGKSSEVLRIADGKVIKIFHSAVSEEMIQREIAAARIAADLHIPTAAPRRRVSIGGEPALLYPEIVGDSLAVAIRRKPLSAAMLLERMAALQRDIHRHEAAGLRAVKSVLATDIDYGPAPAALKKAAIAHLETLPDSGHLLHGDFHINNIIIRDDGLVILDWAKAAIGDPAADVVRSEMLMRFGEGPADPVTSLWRDWAASRLLRAYQAKNGPTSHQLPQWRAVVALAWLRARPSVRDRAFRRYLNKALKGVGLPALTPD